MNRKELLSILHYVETDDLDISYADLVILFRRIIELADIGFNEDDEGT